MVTPRVSTTVGTMSDSVVQFEAPDLPELLQSPDADIDALPFGVVVMDRSGVVTAYNQAESRLSGLDPAAVIGQNFFEQVGPCTNNYLVAQRFTDDDDLDEVIDYVFTFRMAPTPVRLRLLASSGAPHQYLVVQRR